MSRLDEAIDAVVSDSPRPPPLGKLRRRVRHRRRVFASAVGALGVGVVAVTMFVATGNSSPKKSVIVGPMPSVPANLPRYSDLPTRYAAALAYDGARHEVVLFGGGGVAEPTRSDTWRWDGRGWSEARPRVAPPGRGNAAMAYDPNSKLIVLFGGTAQPDRKGAFALNDTWTWDGSEWTERNPEHQPPWNAGVAMSYDPRSRSILLLTLPAEHPGLDIGPNGGSYARTNFGTWQWTGGDWYELPTPAAPPFVGGRLIYAEPRLAPLPDRAGLLFYAAPTPLGHGCPAAGIGGKCDTPPDPSHSNHSQTWTWNGTGWEEQHPSRAPTGGELVAAAPPNAAATVFMGDGSTWQWTGSDWSHAKANGPGPHGEYDNVARGDAVYDDTNQTVVAYAGALNTSGSRYETWTWDGAWSKQEPETGSPPPATSTTNPATRAACTPTQLVGGEGGVGQLLNGDLRVILPLLNRSGTDCVLMLDDLRADVVNERGNVIPRRQLPAPTLRVSRVLRSNQSANVIVRITNWCRPEPGLLGVTLSLPYGGEPTAILRATADLTTQWPPCTGPSEPSTISVTSFVPEEG